MGMSYAYFGSALHSHCRGHRFESGMLHHKDLLTREGLLYYVQNKMQKHNQYKKSNKFI